MQNAVIKMLADFVSVSANCKQSKWEDLLIRLIKSTKQHNGEIPGNEAN